MSDALDNAAAAALWPLLRSPNEKMGALYGLGSGFGQTPTVTTGDRAHTQGKLSVPPGSLSALFHNHPAVRADSHNARLTGDADKFSDDDIAMAKRVGVPSYISAPDGRVLRFDPKTNKTEEVLAEFPTALIEALRK